MPFKSYNSCIYTYHFLNKSIWPFHYRLSPTYIHWFPQKKRSLLHLLSLAHKAIYYILYLKYHKCAFSYMVPSIWNSLPASIRSIHSHPSFITHLKAYISSMKYIHLFNHTILLFYKLYYFIVLFIYLSIYCFRSILLYAPTRGGHTYDKCY